MWRRRLRQDGGGAARGVRGRARRQAGGRRGADHAAGAAACPELHGTVSRLPGQCGAGLAPRHHQGAQPGQEGHRRRLRRHRGRHPRIARQDHQVQGSRPADRRRGAALRRQAQGEAQGASRRRAYADPDRHADPAHTAAGADRRSRSLDHRVAAGRSPGGAHLRGAVRSADGARGVVARALSRRTGVLCLPAHRRSRRSQGLPRQARAGNEGCGGARPDAADRDRGHHVGIL